MADEQKPKTLEDMALGELVAEMIFTHRELMDAANGNDGLTSETTKEYNACHNKYTKIKAELDKREKIYTQYNEDNTPIGT